jgi:biotin operon repressor
MPSRKQPSTSKSPRRVHNKPVAVVKRPLLEARPTTKKQRLIGLLSAAKPVTADKVGRTLDWQPHTVRAAITGLRKAGFVVDTTKGPDGGGTCYRIVSYPQSFESVA